MSPLTLDASQGHLSELAGELADLLQAAQSERGARLVGPGHREVELPEPLLDILLTIVKELQQGQSIIVMPLHKQLTTNEAAEILNVSRPHLIKLLDEHAIPFEYVGTHRRLRLNDVLAYREHRIHAREQALAGLVRLAEELDLEY